MIIACPACATRYEVPDSAIGAEGRTVRCASCRHSWFEAGSEPDEQAWDDEPEAIAADPTSTADSEPEEVADPFVGAEESVSVDPEPEPEAVQPELATGAPIEDSSDQSGNVEDDGGPERPRRGGFRLWAWAAVLLAILVGATLAAASYWGVPAWVPIERPTFAAAQPGLKLDFPAERQERRQLPNGTEFFGASGTITNLHSEAQRVPPILIVLRDGRDRIVYSWEVAPPKRSLAPGESVTVNEAITDVPRSARVAEIGWKPV